MVTRCNWSHCAWRDATRLHVEPLDPWAWRPDVPDLRVRVAPSPLKGLGVFADQPCGPGRHVGRYVGELLNLTQLLDRYAAEPPVYVYRLSASWSIDARASTHFSRWINHDAQPNLHARPSASRRRVELLAMRPVRVGDELTVDYGLGYWRARAERPAEHTDARIAAAGWGEEPPRAAASHREEVRPMGRRDRSWRAWRSGPGKRSNQTCEGQEGCSLL
ncbi:hypothetical protein AB1Y20_007818 [Prymnesium parvum]|uniref:SET domain-containing protein n=1 Tax=Prymnesium parvum TaxID=97485 RepID=A0AB34ITU6_PRYPA